MLRSMKGVLEALRQVKVHACVVGVVVRVRRNVVRRGRDFILFFPPFLFFSFLFVESLEWVSVDVLVVLVLVIFSFFGNCWRWYSWLV